MIALQILQFVLTALYALLVFWPGCKTGLGRFTVLNQKAKLLVCSFMVVVSFTLIALR